MKINEQYPEQIPQNINYEKLVDNYIKLEIKRLEEKIDMVTKYLELLTNKIEEINAITANNIQEKIYEYEKIISSQNEKIIYMERTIKNLEKIVFIGIGIVMTIELLIKILF